MMRYMLLKLLQKCGVQVLRAQVGNFKLRNLLIELGDLDLQRRRIELDIRVAQLELVREFDGTPHSHAFFHSLSREHKERLYETIKAHRDRSLELTA